MKQEVYKKFAKLIQKGIPNRDCNFLRFVERNELFGLEDLFSKRTSSGYILYNWVEGNDKFREKLNEWNLKYRVKGKKITLKEIETYLKNF